jgi:tight adherence protein B
MTALAAGAIVLLAALWWRPRLVAPRGRQARAPRLARRRRRSTPTADEWAALLDAIAADIRSGASLTAACERATTRAEVTGAVIRPGCSPPFDTTASSATADEAVVLQSLSAAHTLGGPMAATLHAGAALLRERAAIRAEAQTHSAQARLSARVLTAVPVVFAAWSLLSSDSFRTAALSPLGLASATAGGLCNLAGWYWMRRIVGRVSV